MLTRPKLMLPFQIARAMMSLLRHLLQNASGNARCMPQGPPWARSASSSIFSVRSLHPLFLFFTGLGTSAVLWPLLLLYYWLVDPLFARRLSIAFAASFLANRILKELFGTDRPFQSDPLLSTRGGGADGHRARLPERALAERRHLLSRLGFHYAAAVALARRRADRAAGGAVAALPGRPPAGGRRRRLRAGSDLRLGGGGLEGPAGLAAVLGCPDRRGDARPRLRRRRGAGRLRPSRRLRRRQAGVHAAADGRRPDRDRAGRRRRHGAHRFLLYWLPEKALPRPARPRSALAYLLYLAAAIVGFGLWPRALADPRPPAAPQEVT